MEDNRGRHQVVIVGGGFGGLQAALKLARAPVEVTVLDRYNHHLFQPLLYQVATAVLSPGDISAPIRQILRGRNTTVLLAEVRAVDLARKVVVSDGGEIPYDTLVLAMGATHSYFGHPEWARFAPGLKTIDDAREIRERLLLAFEAAERETDPERQRDWLTFVIIGAGPTGVELAGALAYMTRHSLPRDYRRVDTSKARVLLLEGLPRVLNAYPEELSAKAREDLEKLGVEVRTGTLVTGGDEEGVTVGDTRIPTRTVLWGAGVAASPVAGTLGVPLDKAGRVKVEPPLNIPGHEDVFVIGDLASLVQDGKPVPGIAPAAMQMGRHVAKNIRHRLAGRPLEPFRYHDKGSFAVIGRGSAIGVLYDKVRLSGRPAWAMWLGIHITFLVGFRNKVAVMLEWAYTYLTKRRDVRLITGLHANKLPPIQAARLPATTCEHAPEPRVGLTQHEPEPSPLH
ncbi:NAD(P)/FAD-dependent oxidoreductase [Archangium violaceum]|uniref:NADH:ubiquinone reductase (non-electrogenic) n=1 Tax=Archangium violaceum Cb vi76 TaxID=1406225 RepID=A0A084SKR5_9BACT|nr:NAD(P)/FAD-dependent oxidoreductase [Archangium violaceum]KFA89050.1 pyridine nucleotide-disulfide oxidoreductase [Archangium violaceum Cb vi76]